MKKVVVSGNLPSSISSSLQLLLIHGPSTEGIVEHLMREEIFSLIGYMLYKHFGDILSIRFSPVVTKASVRLMLKEIRTPSRVFRVDGFAELNPVSKSIYIEIDRMENSEVQTRFKTYVGSGYVVRVDGDYEVRYYA